MADIVKLNVGGAIYTTSRATLTKYPNSMLAAMFSGSLPTTQDEHGNYWIDRNREMFRYVLEFLRSGRLMIPEDFQDFELLQSEADFYQLTDFIKAVQARSSQRYHGHERKDETSKEENLAVKLTLSNTVSSYLQMFGPKDALCELTSILSPYRCGNLNSVTFNKSYLRIENYDCHRLPMVALKVEVFNMGFRPCQDTPDYVNKLGTYTYWFKRPK